MIVVDSHCHASRDWFEPVESLLFQMDRNDVAYSVLIQVRTEYNNDYQFECLRRYPGRFLSVVCVDETNPAALDDLARLKEQGAHGVRFSPLTRSPGEDPLAIWRQAAALELPVSCLGRTSAEFATEEFAGIFREIPDVPIVIEHLGALNVPVPGEGPSYDARRQVFALSRFPNAYVKIHGLGEFTPRQVPLADPRPFGPEIPPLQQMAYDAFGPERMMWGSDFPPVSSREGYRNALQLPMEQFAGRSAGERAMIFGGTALRVFGTP